MTKKWTDEEKDFLANNKAKMTNGKLAEKLGCTKAQVIYALKKYKMQRTKAEYAFLMKCITGGQYKRSSYYHGLSNWTTRPMFNPTLTNKESIFIKRNMYQMSRIKIAAKLKRPVKAVEEYISLVEDLRKAEEKRTKDPYKTPEYF